MRTRIMSALNDLKAAGSDDTRSKECETHSDTFSALDQDAAPDPIDTASVRESTEENAQDACIEVTSA